MATSGARPGWWIPFILSTVHFQATASFMQASLGAGVFLTVFFLGSQVKGKFVQNALLIKMTQEDSGS